MTDTLDTTHASWAFANAPASETGSGRHLSNLSSLRARQQRTTKATDKLDEFGGTTDLASKKNLTNCHVRKSCRPTTVRSPRKPCLLLGLPGEIRNRIYHYVYNVEHEVLMRPANSSSKSDYAHDTSARKPALPKARRCLSIRAGSAAVSPSKSLQCSRKPGQKHLLPKKGIRWVSSPINLLLTCRVIGREASGFLYSNACFSFEDPGRLSSFMSCSTSSNLHCVAKVDLFFKAYGIPYAKADVQWERKHLARWEATLTTLVKLMPDLKDLSLHMHLPNVTAFLGRAFRTVGSPSSDFASDAGPLLLPLPLAKLKHLQYFSLHTSSYLLSCARDPRLVMDMYGPHFEVQGIYHPTTQQQEVVFHHNKMQAEDLHGALDRALKGLLTKGDDLEANFAELLVVVNEWKEWSKDPVGNSLRASMLPAAPLAGPQGMAITLAASATTVAPVYTAPAHIPPAPAQPVNAAKKKPKKKRVSKPATTESSSHLSGPTKHRPRTVGEGTNTHTNTLSGIHTANTVDSSQKPNKNGRRGKACKDKSQSAIRRNSVADSAQNLPLQGPDCLKSTNPRRATKSKTKKNKTQHQQRNIKANEPVSALDLLTRETGPTVQESANNDNLSPATQSHLLDANDCLVISAVQHKSVNIPVHNSKSPKISTPKVPAATLASARTEAESQSTKSKPKTKPNKTPLVSHSCTNEAAKALTEIDTQTHKAIRPVGPSHGVKGKAESLRQESEITSNITHQPLSDALVRPVDSFWQGRINDLLDLSGQHGHEIGRF